MLLSTGDRFKTSEENVKVNFNCLFLSYDALESSSVIPDKIFIEV